MRLQIKGSRRSLVLWFLGFSTAALMIFQIYPQNFFTVDFSSYLVQVDALRGFRQSYSLFWDIKPPGLQVILLLWSIPFGTSFFSFFLLNLLFIALMLVSTYWIIKSFIPQRFQIFACLFVLVTQGFFADYGRNFLSADFIGVTIVVSSTALLLANRSDLLNVLALFGLLYAGSVKEVFIFTPLLYFCLSTKTNWKRIICNFVGSVFLFVMGFISYLLIIGELGEYIQILNFKRIVFTVEPVDFLKNTLFKLFNLAESETLFLIVLLVTLIALAHLMKKGGGLNLLGTAVTTILCLNVLLFSGLVLQQKSYSGHYLLAIYLPATLALLLTVGKIVQHFDFSLTRFNSTLIVVIILGFISNSPNYQKLLSPNTTLQWIQSFEIASDISEYKVAGEGCMQVAYGWGAGSYYHYSNRLPCSKFFIANLVLMSQAQQRLFVKDLLNNPPVDVVYDTRWADLNTSQFESDIFPWKSVLDSCYEKTSRSTFHARFSKERQLKECLALVLDN